MTDRLPEGAEEYAQKAVLAALVVVGVYLALRFYWSVVAFIDVWAPREYADLFEAFFNLAVLLLVAAAFVRQLAKVRGTDTSEGGNVGEEDGAEGGEE